MTAIAHVFNARAVSTEYAAYDAPDTPQARSVAACRQHGFDAYVDGKTQRRCSAHPG